MPENLEAEIKDIPNPILSLFEDEEPEISTEPVTETEPLTVAETTTEEPEQNKPISYDFQNEFKEFNDRFKDFGLEIKDSNSVKTAITKFTDDNKAMLAQLKKAEEDNKALYAQLEQYSNLDPMFLGANEVLKNGGSHKDIVSYLSPNSWSSKDVDGEYDIDDDSVLKAFYKNKYPKISEDSIDDKIYKLGDDIDKIEKAEEARVYLSNLDKGKKDKLIKEVAEKYNKESVDMSKLIEAQKVIEENVFRSTESVFEKSHQIKNIGGFKLKSDNPEALSILKSVDTDIQSTFKMNGGFLNYFYNQDGTFKESILPALRQFVIEVSPNIPIEYKNKFNQGVASAKKKEVFSEMVTPTTNSNDKLKQSNNSKGELKGMDMIKSWL